MPAKRIPTSVGSKEAVESRIRQRRRDYLEKACTAFLKERHPHEYQNLLQDSRLIVELESKVETYREEKD